jgi:hypothetical protein
MKASVYRFGTITTGVLAIILGCTSVLTQVADDTGSVDDTGFSTVDGGFSDAPASPGGTGGVGTPDPGTDDGGDIELPSEATRSFFTAFQVDPVPEDTAGPKFVVSGDVDQDGFLDLVSGWNQSQPVQLHLQRRDASGNISFRTINLGGTNPIAIIAGVELGQINDDGWLDVVVLSKATGYTGFCPTSPPSEISALEGEIIVLFSPGDAAQIPDGDRWTEMILVNPYVQDRWIHNQFPGNETVSWEEIKTKPERAGFTSLAVGDLDGVQGDEIVVTLNPGECKELGQEPPITTVDVWVNPGGSAAEDSALWGVPADITLSRGVPLTILADVPEVTDCAIYDIDGDGDNDVVAAFSNAISLNVRWSRNPLIPDGRAAVIDGFSDPVPDICNGGLNDEGLCPNGDPDCAGIPAGNCVGSVCVGGASNGDPCANSADCPGIENGVCVPGKWRFFAANWEARPVGQVDTAAMVMAIGDVDTDGFLDVVVRSTLGQIVQWFRRPNSLTIPPEFPPNDPVPDRRNFPWPVFTLTELDQQEPEAVSLGDITGDGQNELMVAFEGGVFWYDATVGDSVYDPWFANPIIQDNPPDTTDPNATSSGPAADPTTPGGTGVGVTQVDASTHVNTLLVVDLDGDGKNDIVGTLDRRSGSGLSDDRLVWYRNIRTEEAPAGRRVSATP